MKVPTSNAAAVNTATAAAAPAQTEKAQAATPSSISADQKNALQDRLQKDGFEGMVKHHPMLPIGRPGETMTFSDRQNAAGLKDTLSSPLNQIRVQMGEKDETITRGKDGSYTGPNGEPLAQVKLDDGTTAYVDPNTNKYYLTDESPNWFTGEVQATGPYDLPPGAQFSNSHFSAADVKAVQRHAASESPFDFQKFPPIEFPRLPIDPIKLTAADLKDGGQ